MTILSVRGEAELETDPDGGRVHLLATASGPSTQGVLEALRATVEACVAALTGLGAQVVRTGQRHPLGYLRGAGEAHQQVRWDDTTGEEVTTGTVRGTAGLRVDVRDLELLDRVLEVPALVPQVQLQPVEWFVDPDNPAWVRVRELAVRDAVERARHYAAALGTGLGPVEHLADVGMLGQAEPRTLLLRKAGRASAAAGDGPHQDPRPQLLQAGDELRVLTSGTVSLPD